MTPILRISLLAALAAAPLTAQQPAAATCPVDFNQPKELVTLYNITRAQAIQQAPGDERGKSIKNIMKTLSNPKTIAANPLAVNLFAGQMLLLQMMQPNAGPTATRGTLNWGEPKDAVIDLARTADSLFKTVETGNPGCLSETKVWRQSKPWQDRINAAFKALQTNQVDSAEAYAKSSQVLDATSPYAHRVYAAVAQIRGSQGDMLKQLDLALAATVGDTMYNDDRRAVLFQIGQVGLEYAELQPEPARSATLKKAAAALVTLTTEAPSADATPYALSGLGMAATSLKDSSLFVKCYSMVDAALDKFSDMSVLQAAICANRNGKTADAVRLFQATLAKNPNARDALYNGAALLYELRKPQDMLPMVQKLVSIDPSNPDNVSLFAYAYNVINEQNKPATPAPAATPAPVAPAKPGAKPGAKVPAAPAPAPVVTPPSPWADSVAKYMKLSDDMPQRVLVTEFVRYSDRANLKGDVENRTKTARAFEITFEFLDLSGAVVDTQVAKVASVAAGQTGTFTIASTKPKIAAWRYAPIK